jgi:hypothetical protein
MVPDKVTAVSIAEAVLTPIYGKETVFAARPFDAKLIGDVWNVDGSIPPRSGGTLHIEISRKNGCVLKILAKE